MKRIFGIIIVITALLLPQAALAASNNVKLLNISIDKGKIQTDNNVQKVIIEITDLADFTIKENGNKLLVQLNNAKIGSTVKNMAVNTELIKDIKVDKITKTSTMVNIGLSKEISKVEYTVSTLPKNSKTKKGFCVVLTLQESNNKLLFSPNIKGKTIVIDPGHGGSDPGAIGPTGVKEKDVNFAVAKQVEKILKNAGANVILTRVADVDVARANASAAEELGARVNIAIKNNADIFVSIHSNSFGNESAQGTATYFYSKTDKDGYLANAIQKGMVEYGKRYDRGIIDTNFYVTKRSPMPAALTELAFLSNYKEESLLNSQDFQKNLAIGICKGINDYFLKFK